MAGWIVFRWPAVIPGYQYWALGHMLGSRPKFISVSNTARLLKSVFVQTPSFQHLVVVLSHHNVARLCPLEHTTADPVL